MTARTPLFFGPEARSLFGWYHAPDGGARGDLVGLGDAEGVAALVDGHGGDGRAPTVLGLAGRGGAVGVSEFGALRVEDDAAGDGLASPRFAQDEAIADIEDQGFGERDPRERTVPRNLPDVVEADPRVALGGAAGVVVALYAARGWRRADAGGPRTHDDPDPAGSGS